MSKMLQSRLTNVLRVPPIPLITLHWNIVEDTICAYDSRISVERETVVSEIDLVSNIPSLEDTGNENTKEF